MKRVALLSLLAMMALPGHTLDRSKKESIEVRSQEQDAPESAVIERLKSVTVRENNRRSDDLEPVTQPDGSVIVDLDGRFLHALVAHVAEDGSIHFACTDSHQVVEQALNADVEEATPAGEEK